MPSGGAPWKVARVAAFASIVFLATSGIVGIAGAPNASGPLHHGSVPAAPSVVPAQPNETGLPCNASNLAGGAFLAGLARPPAGSGSSPLRGSAQRTPATNGEFYFTETGLEYNTRWAVVLIGLSNGTGNGTINSTNDTIIFFETSGTYIYLVPQVAGYLEGFCAVITVINTAVHITLPFTPFPQWAPPLLLAGIALWGIFVAAVAAAWVRRT